MPDLQEIDKAVHDLLDEVNGLLLKLELSEVTDSSQAAELLDRMRNCAQQAEEAGRMKSAKHLRQVAGIVERWNSKTNS
jgi:hypothetical protein